MARHSYSALVLALSALTACVLAQSKADAVRSKAGTNRIETVTSSDLPRTFEVHVPKRFDSRHPLPVVMVFHGLFLTGQVMKKVTQFDELADKQGFLVVYPEALSKKWNDGPLNDSGVSDVRFVSDMLEKLGREFPIDKRRIYACGLSNGGYFSQKLACEMPNRIAAIGVVAAAGLQDVLATSKKPVPIAFFLGTRDPLIPRGKKTEQLGKLGDLLGFTDLGIKAFDTKLLKAGGFMSVSEVLNFWVRNNKCDHLPRAESLPDIAPSDGCKAKREVYQGAAEVVCYTLEGAGHTWPGGHSYASADITGRTCQDIKATEILWQFFASHPLP